MTVKQIEEAKASCSNPWHVTSEKTLGNLQVVVRNVNKFTREYFEHFFSTTTLYRK